MLYINNQTNTCVTVNRSRAALKVTARYIPAATVCFILIIKQILVTVNSIRAALKETACYIPAATVCFTLIIKQILV